MKNDLCGAIVCMYGVISRSIPWLEGGKSRPNRKGFYSTAFCPAAWTLVQTFVVKYKTSGPPSERKGFRPRALWQVRALREVVSIILI